MFRALAKFVEGSFSRPIKYVNITISFGMPTLHASYARALHTEQNGRRNCFSELNAVVFNHKND